MGPDGRYIEHFESDVSVDDVVAVIQRVVVATAGGPKQAAGFAQLPAGRSHPTAKILGGASLPLDPFTPFLEDDNNTRIQSTAALREVNLHSINQAEWTYPLMMHMSHALGVNCDYCHSSHDFRDWAQSPPQRTTAWYGIRMGGDLNQNYPGPLQPVFSPDRLGQALGDAPTVNCATCHNGLCKSLFGVSMAKNFPELTGVPVETAPVQ
ncbi:MAG: photosynthetic reaction center cytochrome PufC [Geminicoccaceae bacterium]